MANVDGVISRTADAHITVMDRGFLYGDSIYETVRTYGGEVFALDEHIQRLRASAASIQLDVPWSTNELSGILRDIVAARPAGRDTRLRDDGGDP